MGFGGEGAPRQGNMCKGPVVGGAWYIIRKAGTLSSALLPSFPKFSLCLFSDSWSNPVGSRLFSRL